LPSQHTKCELFQDSILCHTLLDEDIYGYDYLKPLEVDCTDTSKFILNLDPTEKVIKEPIPTFWATILKENYPNDYKNDPPDINAWHRVLSVFKTNSHQCMMKAVDKLMLGLGQDPTKIERKSRGFIGIL
jgi:hypothetical protein